MTDTKTKYLKEETTRNIKFDFDVDILDSLCNWQTKAFISRK